MSDYPVMLQLAGKCCVVVGSGPVGLRKVQGLLAAGARVRLIAPELTDQTAPDGVETVPRSFRPGDLAGAFLAFAATGDGACDRAVAEEARRLGIPVCLAGLPREGDFTLPALLRRGDLSVAVSTAGRSPALATLVRDRLETLLSETWATVLEIAAAARQHALVNPQDIDYSRETLRCLLEGGLPELLAARDEDGIDRLLREAFGLPWSLAALGISLPERKP